MVNFIIIFLLLICAMVPEARGSDETPDLSLEKEALARVFSGEEIMHFSISWSGGIKIGDLRLAITRTENNDGLLIKARVTDYGMFRLFYPVDDTFSTFIRKPLMLPYRYEVLQKEGHGERETRRLTLYNQQRLQVSYQKNKEPWKKFNLPGIAYNEFSSFFITRVLEFREEQTIVPTFVDEKRHEVVVYVLGREKKNSLLGEVQTIKVMPKMNFKGLYDKDGDTVFWLTDDACRVPVLISSKILIGSLTADLVQYINPACPEWTGREKK